MLTIKMKRILAGLVLLSLLLPVVAYAQDTPENIREAAITDLNARIPGIGRPSSWDHYFEDFDDTNLNCPLLGRGSEMQNDRGYVVNLHYSDGQTYTLHVTSDGSYVMPCDPKLVSGGAGDAIDATTGCSGNVLAKTRLTVGMTAQVIVPSLNTYNGPGYNQTQNPNPLASGDQIIIVGGPICTGDTIWWQFNTGGNPIYAPEVEANSNIYYLQAYGVGGEIAPSGPTGTSPNYGYVSTTCPASFAGTDYMTPLLRIGDIGMVNPGGINNRIRHTPNGDITGVEMPPESTFVVLEGPEFTGSGVNPIVWWKVQYNGTIGWTAESQQGTYYLQNQTLGLSAAATATPLPTQVSSASTTGAAGTGTSTVTLPATRTPINTGNVTRLNQIGVLNFSSSIINMDTGNSGHVLVNASGAPTTDVYFYQYSGTALTQQYTIPLETGVETFAGVNPAGDQAVFTSYEASRVTTEIQTFPVVFGVGGVSRTPVIAFNTGSFHDLAFSSDGRVAVMSYENVQNNTYHLDIVNMSLGTATALSPGGNMWTLAVSPNNQLIAGFDISNGTVRMWNMTTLAESTPLNLNVAFGMENPAAQLTFSPDSSKLAVGLFNSTVQIWDVATQNVQTITLPQSNTTVFSMDYSPDGTLLAVGVGESSLGPSAINNIYLYDTSTNALLASLSGHNERVMNLEFSADGTLLLSGGGTSVILWAVQ